MFVRNTRRMRSAFNIACALVLVAVFGATPPQRVYTGHNVTVTGTRALQAFLVEAPSVAGSIHVDMWEVDAGKTVLTYDVDMTKLLHMIVVSDDLADFQHIHPVLHANGHFSIDVRTREQGLYHIYIDGVPHGTGRQVFRFDVPIGSDAAAAHRELNPAGDSQRAGPYVVTLDPVTVPFGEISTIEVSVTKNGKIANNLHPYLGAMAHGVFIGTQTLAYMHGHGMSDAMLDMAGGDCGDSMMLSMRPLPANSTIDGKFAFEILAPSGQPYDFWLQFVGGKTLYTVPFLVTTR